MSFLPNFQKLLLYFFTGFRKPIPKLVTIILNYWLIFHRIKLAHLFLENPVIQKSSYWMLLGYIFQTVSQTVILTLSRGGGKNACATYFGHISSMEARIFMKFETYVHKIVLDHQPNFHRDPCKDARARGENARTCDALQRFRSETTKIKKMRFSSIFE